LIDEVLLAANTKMGKTIEALRKELASIRTGRATPALVDDIKVDYYGTPTPLKQIATVSAPEARLLLIQPWDSSTLSSIKKAILKSELGLNPTRDALEELRKLEREKEISQDEQKRAQEQLQELTDSFIVTVGKVAEDKEAELLEI
jgi:ribosome recycling factor